MRSLSLFLFFLIIGLAVQSQVEVKLEDAAKHVGDSVKVCGKVAGIRFMENSKGQPTLINLGAAYPNQLLTVVIWADMRKQFDKAPEELLKDKEICVTGRVELFRDKPQIVIRNKDQLNINN